MEPLYSAHGRDAVAPRGRVGRLAVARKVSIQRAEEAPDLVGPPVALPVVGEETEHRGEGLLLGQRTEAGIRLVDVLPALRDELLSHRHANASAAPNVLVFPTSSGSRRDKDNARERVIRPVVAHAEALLAKRGRDRPPAGVAAHKLRHTFASILFVRGEARPT